MGDQGLRARRERAMGNSPLFYRQPVHLVRGEGIWLYDDAGRRYMDAYNNVPCVGHCHPRVVDALQRQGVLVVPGRGFGMPGYFRISYCVEQRELEGAAPGFARVIAELRP